MLSQGVIVDLSHWLAKRGSKHTFNVRDASGQYDDDDETKAPCVWFSMVTVLQG
jgi:hypothetical protein